MRGIIFTPQEAFITAKVASLHVGEPAQRIAFLNPQLAFAAELYVKENEKQWMSVSPSVPVFLHEFSDGLRLLQIIAHGAPIE